MSDFLSKVAAALPAGEEGDLIDVNRLLIAKHAVAVFEAELAAREVAAERRGMEQAALIAAERGAWASNDADAESLVDRLEARGRMDAAGEIAAAIRALPIDPTGALSRALAAEREAGRREGLEQAALRLDEEADRLAAIVQKRLREEQDEPDAPDINRRERTGSAITCESKTRDCAVLIRAAIRARGEGGGE